MKWIGIYSTETNSISIGPKPLTNDHPPHPATIGTKMGGPVQFFGIYSTLCSEMMPWQSIPGWYVPDRFSWIFPLLYIPSLERHVSWTNHPLDETTPRCIDVSLTNRSQPRSYTLGQQIHILLCHYYYACSTPFYDNTFCAVRVEPSLCYFSIVMPSSFSMGMWRMILI